jgi:hypothetical protein
VVIVLAMETWKDVPGFEGSYQVSDLGRVRSLRILKPTITTGTGYPAVTLTGQQRFAIHVLAARAFLGPRPQGMHVNHRDSNRANNRWGNLEYVTPSENLRHSYREGNNKLYFTEKQMDRIADMFFHDGRSMSDVAREFLPERYTDKRFKSIRKRVKSVIETWRSHRRPSHGWRGPHQFKLSDEKAKKMQEMRRLGYSLREIARTFGCHESHASRVVRGLMWNKVK